MRTCSSTYRTAASLSAFPMAMYEGKEWAQAPPGRRTSTLLAEPPQKHGRTGPAVSQSQKGDAGEGSQPDLPDTSEGNTKRQGRINKVAREFKSKPDSDLKEQLKDLRAAVDTLAKLIQVHGIQLAGLTGATYITMIGKTNHPAAAAVKAKGAQYAEACKGKSPEEHGRGPPAPHMAMGLLVELLTISPDKEGGLPQELWKALKAKQEQYDGRDPTDLSVIFRVCRATGCYKKEQTKLIFCIRDAELEFGVKRALEHHGFVHRAGKVPPGALEERIAGWLSSQKKSG